MKLLLCESCFDIVTPSPRAMRPRFCGCKESACWWADPKVGTFVVWSKHGKQGVSVLGLHNGLLQEKFPQHGPPDALKEFGCITKDKIERLISETPGSYLFKQVGSLIVRLRPGYSGDTSMASDEEMKRLSETDAMLALAAVQNPKHGVS